MTIDIRAFLVASCGYKSHLAPYNAIVILSYKVVHYPETISTKSEDTSRPGDSIFQSLENLEFIVQALFFQV